MVHSTARKLFVGFRAVFVPLLQDFTQRLNIVTFIFQWLIACKNTKIFPTIQIIFKNHPSSVTFFNHLKISVITIKKYESICHYLSLFAGILMVFRPKTVTLQALFSKSHYDKRVLTRKQTILHLTTNYQKGAFKLKIAEK